MLVEESVPVSHPKSRHEVLVFPDMCELFRGSCKPRVSSEELARGCACGGHATRLYGICERGIQGLIASVPYGGQ